VRQSIESTVRERVTALFRAKGISQAEFAGAIGVKPSWVSHFIGGTRNANDLPLLVRIARFFGVTVGYLLSETERGRDPGATILLTTYEALDARGRALLLDLAASLGRSNGPADGSEGGGRNGGNGRTGSAGSEPPKRKRR
jgi:transcriptional regulator with XRE-family HTH domain